MSCRVLLIEDESIVAFLFENMLAELGYVVTETCGSVGAALEMIDRGDFDIALLDLNLGGAKSFPVADRLVEKSVPFIFLTGHGRRGLDGRYPDIPVLEKPFLLKDLEQALSGLLANVAK